jgi:hypothetical protein
MIGWTWVTNSQCRLLAHRVEQVSVSVGDEVPHGRSRLGRLRRSECRGGALHEGIRLLVCRPVDDGTDRRRYGHLLTHDLVRARQRG